MNHYKLVFFSLTFLLCSLNVNSFARDLDTPADIEVIRGQVEEAGREQNLSEVPPSEEARGVFESMSPEMQKDFLESRKAILGFTSKMIGYNRLSYGWGSVISSRITQIVSKFRRKGHPLENLAQDAGTPAAKEPFKRRLLNQIDHQLWLAAPIVAEQNEFAISAWLGVILEAGTRKHGLGGSLGLGISIGYNKEKQAFVFEVFQDVDSFEKGITGVFLAGIAPKVGLTIINQKQGEEMRTRKGQSLYPPVAPLFSSKYSDMAVIGMNSALLSFPPVIGDAFAYVNNSSRRTLFRITVSPVMKGFLRFKAAPPDLSPFVSGVMSLFRKIESIVRDHYRRSPASRFTSCANWLM